MALCADGYRQTAAKYTVYVNEVLKDSLCKSMSRLLHSVEEARSRYIFEFGHPRPKAKVPNEPI